MKEKIIKLLQSKKFADLKEYLNEQNTSDLSSIFEDFDDESILKLFRLLTKDNAAEVFTDMDSDLQMKLINSLTDKELKDVIDELFTDDTVDLIEEMPSNVVKRILKGIPASERKVINEFLNYPENSAGSIMTNEFVDLKESMTVKQAFEKIRKVGVDKETIYNCYVLDSRRKLIGLVSVRDLLLNDNDTVIKDIMETNIISANTLEDEEEVSKRLVKYGFLALPVVDNENRLVGIITVDDAVEVIEDENTEDFVKMAAMNPSEDSYFKTSIFKHAKNRIMWLLILMISSTITGMIITNYENAFAAIPLLVAFIPMLMGTGGNCGSQASTLVIRGLAMDEIKLKDYFKVLFKEIRIALSVGITLAIIIGLGIFIIYKNTQIAAIVGITLICTVTLSKTLGCTLPMIAKKLKLDPAIMAAPLISTIVDTCSVLIYFNIAMIFISNI